MKYQNINALPGDYAVIDLDTGTVLGTNLVVVQMPDENVTPGHTELILSSDSEAWDYGNRNGLPLYRPVED